MFLGNDVWKKFILQPFDFILQKEFFLLHALNGQSVSARAGFKGLYGQIEVAMLCSQMGELVADLSFFSGVMIFGRVDNLQLFQ